MMAPTDLADQAVASPLPARDAEMLGQALPVSERNKYGKHCSRIAKALDQTEQVVALAHCMSGKPGVLALTNERLLFANKPDVITPMALGQWPLTNISTVHPVRDGLLVGRKEPQGDLGFTMAPEMAEALVPQFEALGIARRAQPAAGQAPAGPDRAALRVLPDKTKKLALDHIGPNETVFLCLVGASGQALIALADRVLIVKAGFMSGHAFGGQVIAFPYREITGIEIQTHMTTAVLQIQTASFSGTRPGGYWSNDKSTDPFKLPNCLPLSSKKVVGAWQGHLATLRQAIANGGFPNPAVPQERAPSAPAAPSPPSTGGLAAELQQLAELRASGALSDDEFAQAKSKLLG